MGLLEQEIELFLKTKKVLVFDDKRASRLEIKRALIGAGVDPKKLFIEKNFENALQIIHTHSPEVIISEFQVHDDFGLELARLQIDLIGDYSKKVFIVVTGSATQASVADAAEEEVDAFLVKPITSELVAEYLYATIRRKINPSAYASMIFESRKLIKEGNLDIAEQTLGMAKLMYERPMMACYHMGNIFFKKGDFTTALEEYNQGLEFNALHYRCLVGRFLALIELGKKYDAFECLNRISSNFPLTPEVLKKAFILSITSYRFDDVNIYYEQYLKQPRKPRDLKLTVSQALMTAGKILLRERKHPKIALDYFKKGSIISGRTEIYLKDVMDTLLREGFSHETDNFFSMFKPNDVNSTFLKQLRFKVFAKTMHKYPLEIIEKGKLLIYSSEADEEIFVIVCNLLKKSERKNLLTSIVYKGVEQLPNSKEKLLKYIDAA